ncbi:MAG: hypothetical protein Q9195_007073 [Heterodermia aff. obscurata]
MFGNRQGAPGGLSINTNAANSSGLGGSGQAPKSGSLFGNIQQNKSAGSLFGASTATSQPQTNSTFGTTTSNQGGGLFGSSIGASQPQQSSGLFGTTGSSQSGLFGASTATSQPQPNNNPFGGGLFGEQGIQQSQGGGLFGGSSTTQQSTGVFGQTTQPQSNSMFAPQSIQQQQGSGLFGSSLQPQTTTIFGGSVAQNKPTSSLLGASTTQSQGQAQAQTQPLPLPAPSIFTASIGQLSQQQQTVPGVRVNVSELRPTTRFNDLHEDLQKMIENIDNFVIEQMKFQAQCELALEGQGEGVQRGVAKAAETIPADVEQCQTTLGAVQQALENDAQAIAYAKQLTKADAANANLSFKALSTLRTPQQFQNSSLWNAPNISQIVGPTLMDDDIVPGAAGNLVSYFSSQADDMSKALESYKKRTNEVETHLGGMEASMMNQIQEFIFVRNRDGNPKSAEDQVRELATVLNEMETGIVSVASRVTGAREQVQDLGSSVDSNPFRGRYGRY